MDAFYNPTLAEPEAQGSISAAVSTPKIGNNPHNFPRFTFVSLHQL
jgi:hypothetical protein